jgi:hypothetical protein
MEVSLGDPNSWLVGSGKKPTDNGKMDSLPSGKRLHNYGKSPFSMGKSTILTGPFSIAM